MENVWLSKRIYIPLHPQTTKGIVIFTYVPFKLQRGVAQPGSAPGLGPGGAGSNPVAPTYKRITFNKKVVRFLFAYSLLFFHHSYDSSFYPDIQIL